MSVVFGSVYANAYDTLYQDKDYASECDLLERIFEQYGERPIRTLLDLGCGTGNHDIPLAERGFIVTGIDYSQDMLKAAEAKVRSRNLPLILSCADIRKVNLDKTFDAVLMMFAVLGYQIENADVLAALKSARRHLRPGGLLVLDVWYGPAVLAQRPNDRVKVIPVKDGKILRMASGELDISHQICTVRYNIWHLSGNTLIAEAKEEHHMRFFFPCELRLFLQMAGFSSIRIGAFPNFNKDPDDSSWNAILICRAE